MALPYISICSGIGLLDLAIKIAEPQLETACYVERDSYCAATLVARMGEQTLDRAPIWSDLKSFPSAQFKGARMLIGGIPCQPYSAAGKQLGADDDRCLWDTTWQIMRDIGAEGLFLENSANFLRHPDGLLRALERIAELGLHAEWGVFSCKQLGAPHTRKRLYLLAYTDSLLLRIQQGRRSRESGQGEAQPGITGSDVGHSQGPSGRSGEDGHPESSGSRRGRPHNTGSGLVDPQSQGLEEWGWESEESGSEHPITRLVYTSGPELEEGWGQGEEQRRSMRPGRILPFWPPGQETELWADWPEHLWPSSQRPLRGKTDGRPAWLVAAEPYRTDQLRCLGNAVSPLQAIIAWSVLTDRAMKKGNAV